MRRAAGNETVADYIVIGGGSSGAVVAARLAEAGLDTLLVEAGPRDLNPWLHVPLGYGKVFGNPGLTWPYEVETGPAMDRRRIYQPRGKVLGGTGAINGMTYLRGDPRIYDAWGAGGASGWDYDSLLPFFRKAETNQRGADRWHGDAGPVHVSDAPPHPLMDAFLDSARSLGLPVSIDLNRGEALGAAAFQFTIRDGVRSSSASGHLRAQKGRLRVLTKRRADRILFDGRRAAGVLCTAPAGPERLTARREIILAAGSFGSPRLLQLSGVGPAGHLQRLGIEVVADLPGVGMNLQDHFESRVIFRCTAPVTINERYASFRGRIGMGLEYLLRRSGPLAGAGVLGGGLFRLTGGQGLADCQINLGIWTTSRQSAGGGALLDPDPAFRLTVVDLCPDARGILLIDSPDPAALPRIVLPFLETARDREAIVRAMDLARKLGRSGALARFAGAEMVPEPGLTGTDGGDEAMLDYARAEGRPNFHAVGTCRLGTDPLAVVDPGLRLHGIAGLRIADASVMPLIPNANTNAACLAIGERAAELIASEAKG